MKIARVAYKGRAYYAYINKAKADLLEGSVFDDARPNIIKSVDINDISLLAPAEPSKIVCAGLNYKEHAKELEMDMPERPVIFLKPPSAVIGPDDLIIYPDQTAQLEYEAELAIVIKKKVRSVTIQQSRDYILGYTCLNDITARDIQKQDIQWTRAKSFDSFCPLGPYIETELNPNNLTIKLSVNGIIKQLSSTSDMIFGIERLISFVSDVMTLMPGDIVATGTPKGVGPLKRGDSVDIEIEGIGRLSNKVAL
jgi:2-keto-4-pentenoate hydratase/2-oxohepta-3-ene-1,7-dioic acid hydratase in catechol pathway